jgi:sugar phosphate isomerase/epimerase
MTLKLGAYTACLHDRPLEAAMSGTPGSDPGARYPSWVVNPWDGVYMDVLDYQWDVAAEFWTGFLSALADIDPDMAVNIEHEDASYTRLDGLALAAGNLRAAAAKM